MSTTPVAIPPTTPSTSVAGRTARRCSRLLAWLAACALAPAALAEPVFLETGIVAAAWARATSDLPLLSDRQTASLSQAAGNVRVSAGVYSGRPGGSEAMASQSFDLTMNGPANGTLFMTNSTVVRNPVGAAVSVSGDSGWHYRFQAGEDGWLRVRYDVDNDPLLHNTTTDNAFGISIKKGRAYARSSALWGNSEGMLSFMLTAGEIYELAIYSSPSYSTGMMTSTTRSFLGAFEWTIEGNPPVQAVPEPSALMLALGALAALGALQAGAARSPRRV